MKRLIAFLASALIASSAFASELFIGGLVVQMRNPDPPVWWQDQYFAQNNNGLYCWSGCWSNELSTWLAHDPNLRYVAWVNPDGTEGGQVASCAAHPGCIGFQVGDEPGNIFELNDMRDGCNAITNGLCIINLRPSSSSFIVNQAAKYPDILSATNYDMGLGSWGIRARTRSAALANGIPYWTYLSTKGQEADLWWSAMSSLALGFTGFTWFVEQLAASGHPTAEPFQTMYAAHGDYNAARTASWYTVQEINAVLEAWSPVFSELDSYGYRIATSAWYWNFPYPTFSASADVPHVWGVSRPDGGDFLLGSFRDNGVPYVVLMNMRHPSGDTAGTTGNGLDDIVLTTDLDPGDEVFVLQEDGTLATKTVDPNQRLGFNIEAGHLVLFKFDDGQPFVGIQ